MGEAPNFDAVSERMDDPERARRDIHVNPARLHLDGLGRLKTELAHTGCAGGLFHGHPCMTGMD